MLADLGALQTLPPRQFAAGYAEVVKYGLIDDEPFFFWLEANRRDIFSGGPARAEAVARSCAAKTRFVLADEKETGVRALLNLGHTFGHALEAATGFSDRLLQRRGREHRHGAGARLFGQARSGAEPGYRPHCRRIFRPPACRRGSATSPARCPVPMC